MIRGKRVEENLYWVDRLATEFGTAAFQLEKAGDGTEENETYHVHLDNPQDASCTCPGNTYHGNCKHVDAVRKLLELGKL